MARVPYNPVPEVGQSARGLPEFRVDTPIAAFGGASAQATEGLGKTLERSSDELFQRAMAMQQLANTNEASEAATNFMIASGDLRAQYGSLQGKDAVNAYPKFASDMKALQGKFAGEMSNPMVKRMFDQETRGTMARTIFSAAGHAATENKQWTVDSANARVAVSNASIADDPYDDIAFNNKLKDIRANTRVATVAKHGETATKDIIGAAELNATSGATRLRVESFAKKDPAKAGELLEQYRKQKMITEDDFKKAEQAVLLGRHSNESRIQAARINSDLSQQEDPKLPEKTLDDRVKEARDWAKKAYPDDPVMEEYTVAATRNGYTAYKRDIADAKARNLGVMQEAVSQNINGKLPTTLDDLFISDKARAAYLKLPEGGSERKAVLRALELNAKDDVAESEATYANYHRFRGMASSEDPEVRKEFMDTFFPSVKELPRKRRDQLAKLQADVKKKGEADPRVVAGMRILSDAGIAPRFDRDKEANLQFRGALQEALDSLRDSGEKPPKTLEDWKKIGATLLREVPKTGYIWDYKIYEVPVPSEVKDQLKQVYPNITDDEAQREYAKLRFMEAWKATYGKK